MYAKEISVNSMILFNLKTLLDATENKETCLQLLSVIAICPSHSIPQRFFAELLGKSCLTVLQDLEHYKIITKKHTNNDDDQSKAGQSYYEIHKFYLYWF